MEGKSVPEAEVPTPEEPGKERVVEIKKPPEGQPNIEITFLYVVHTPENVDAVWKKIKNADLVLLESAGGTKEERQEEAHITNFCLLHAKEDSYSPALRPFIKGLQESGSFTQNLIAKILKEGGGKRVEFIDISEEEPTYQEVKRARNLDTQIRAHLHRGRVEKAIALFPDYIGVYAASSAERENTVAGQLRKRFNEIEGKKRVTVIQGATHTPTYHTIRRGRPAFPTRYEFVPAPYRLPLAETLMRRRRFFPEKGIHDEEYRRAFAENYLITPGAETLWPDAQLPELESFASRLLKFCGDETGNCEKGEEAVQSQLRRNCQGTRREAWGKC